MGDAVGLVADIGRVSVRFGLTGGPHAFGPAKVAQFATADYATFTDALVAYVDQVGLRGQTVPSALAVAGMVHGDVITLTGSRWYVSPAGIQAVLRAKPLALNEFAASALALTRLGADDFTALPGPAPTQVRAGGNYLVIGPGTGLGVAGLISAHGKLAIVASEGAHISFAPRTPDEHKIVAQLARRGPVGNEAILSAGGLIAAYGILSDGAASATRAEEITLKGARDSAAAAAIATFTGALGAVVGDLVLALGAWDGVFMTGAIARSVAPQLGAPAFRKRMEDKTAFRRQLAQVPVALVKREDLELIGAAAALAEAQ